jgi:hypothetical protein
MAHSNKRILAAGAAFSIAAVVSLMGTPVLAAGPTDSTTATELGSLPANPAFYKVDYPGASFSAFGKVGTVFPVMFKMDQVFPKVWVIFDKIPN